MWGVGGGGSTPDRLKHMSGHQTYVSVGLQMSAVDLKI